ncbi:hypothetical protein ACS0TY_012549 [Phlomoides rotata]
MQISGVEARRAELLLGTVDHRIGAVAALDRGVAPHLHLPHRVHGIQHLVRVAPFIFGSICSSLMLCPHSPDFLGDFVLSAASCPTLRLARIHILRLPFDFGVPACVFNFLGDFSVLFLPFSAFLALNLLLPTFHTLRQPLDCAFHTYRLLPWVWPFVSFWSESDWIPSSWRGTTQPSRSCAIFMPRLAAVLPRLITPQLAEEIGDARSLFTTLDHRV